MGLLLNGQIVETFTSLLGIVVHGQIKMAESFDIIAAKHVVQVLESTESDITQALHICYYIVHSLLLASNNNNNSGYLFQSVIVV